MISREEVLKLAELARLQVGEDEVAALQKDISDILAYIGQVSRVEVGKETVAPEHHTVMREDTPRESDDLLAGKEEALRAAFPKRERDFNSVRTIIQKDG